MGCGPSSSLPRPPAILFPPERDCTDTCWLYAFGVFSVVSIFLVLYSSLNIEGFSSYYLEDFPDVNWGNFWKLLLVSTAFAILFTVIIASIIQWMTRITIYVFIVLISVFFLWGAIYFGIKANGHNFSLDSGYTIAFICFAIGLGFWLVFIWVAYKQNYLELILGLYEMATQIVQDLPMLLVVSVVGFIVSSIAIIVTTIMASVVWCDIIQDYRENPEVADKRVFLHFVIVIVILTGLWWKFFLGNCANFVIGYAVGNWYFAEDKKTLDNPLKNGVKYLVYHFGTLLFGSFIMAAIELIQQLLNGLRRHIQKKKAATALLIIALVLECLVSCCKVYWDIISSNAYYITAFFGLSFCEALKFGQQITNLGVSSLFYIMGRYVVMIGVGFVTVLTIFVTRELVSPVTKVENGISYAIICIVAIAISAMILSVYSTITRALYVCVCVDLHQSPAAAFASTPGVIIILEKTKFVVQREGSLPPV